MIRNLSYLDVSPGIRLRDLELLDLVSERLPGLDGAGRDLGPQAGPQSERGVLVEGLS